MSRNSLSTEMIQSAKGSSINTKQYLVYWSVLEALHRTLLTIGTTGSLDLTRDTIRTCQKVFLLCFVHTTGSLPSFTLNERVRMLCICSECAASKKKKN